jgi:hypothetical protein
VATSTREKIFNVSPGFSTENIPLTEILSSNLDGIFRVASCLLLTTGSALSIRSEQNSVQSTTALVGTVVGVSVGDSVGTGGPGLGDCVGTGGPGLGDIVWAVGPALGDGVGTGGAGLGDSVCTVGPALGDRVGTAVGFADGIVTGGNG